MKNRYGILGDVGKIGLVLVTFLLLSCTCIHSLDLIAFLSAFDAREVTKNSGLIVAK